MKAEPRTFRAILDFFRDRNSQPADSFRPRPKKHGFLTVIASAIKRLPKEETDVVLQNEEQKQSEQNDKDNEERRKRFAGSRIRRIRQSLIII